MKKRRIKRSVKIVLIIIAIVMVFGLISIIFSNNSKSNKVIKAKELNLVSVLAKRLKKYNIDTDFISWVDSNYSGSLSKLNKALDKNEYDISMWHDVTNNSYIVLNDLYNKRYDNMDNVKILDNKDKSTISFVGDVSLADNWFIAPKYDERGGITGVLGDKILNVMTTSDIMIANSEFTVSNRGSKIPGKTYTFRAKPERLSIYDEMGVDMVTLANNHVYDYGLDAFLDMLEYFSEYKIPNIGSGHNIEEAEKPFYFILNGYKIAFISATRAEKNIMTPGATIDSGGVFRCYDPKPMIDLISELKETSDYVIPIIHFGHENSHELEDEQVSSAHAYIDAGASMVVGHHAHTLQGVEIYNDKPIIYNLGNFLFNNETIDTALFKVELNKDGSMEYYMLPALQKNSKTEMLEGLEKNRVINDINSWSINAKIDDDGKIIKIN